MPDLKLKPIAARLIPDERDDDGLKLPNWDEWHVPARDTQGHYINRRVKLPKQLDAELYRIVDSGIFPYKSVGYVWRHSLLRHVLHLSRHPEYAHAGGSTINAVLAMIKLIRDEEYMEDFRMIFPRLEERVRDYLSRDNRNHARQLVTQIWAEVAKMTDDFWRGEYELELKRRFGELLKEQRR